MAKKISEFAKSIIITKIMVSVLFHRPYSATRMALPITGLTASADHVETLPPDHAAR
jgi:hypothetical protein